MSDDGKQGFEWQDEGLFPVAIFSLSYVGVLIPTLVWALVGVGLMVFGTLVTFAMWHGASSRARSPSPATRVAVWMLRVWVPWALLGRALVSWLSS